jgi:Asp/Glu/hydantoin racemase
MACRVLLINPNSSTATTDMMVRIAQQAAGADFDIAGATATRAPGMIVDPRALEASAQEVVEIALSRQGGYDGLIVAAFGDPGLVEIRAQSTLPAVGIGESAMLEAAENGRAFGIATTTPDLAVPIGALAHALGLSGQYTGIRLTEGDPAEIVRNPDALRAALAEAARHCIDDDGAQAVIIGGGPLGQAALALQPAFAIPIIAPIAASVRRLAMTKGLRPLDSRKGQ